MIKGDEFILPFFFFCHQRNRHHPTTAVLLKSNMTKRLRSLAVQGDTSAIISSSKKCFWLLKTLLAGIVLSTIFLIYNDDHFMNDLKRLALSQYQLYAYGESDYCNTVFDPSQITKTLRENVYSQESAVEQLTAALEMHENITSVAIIGPQGVGKSLALSIIQNTFPWQYNMQQMTWTNYASQSSLVHRLMRLILNLTPCGQNGIFVENVRIEDARIIDEFNEKLHEYCRENAIKVLAFYVFNSGESNVSKLATGARATKAVTKDRTISIHKTKLVYFRQFNLVDLMTCIDRETKRLGVILSEKDIRMIAANIDVVNTGCKTVVAKISRHNAISD